MTRSHKYCLSDLNFNWMNPHERIFGAVMKTCAKATRKKVSLRTRDACYRMKKKPKYSDQLNLMEKTRNSLLCSYFIWRILCHYTFAFTTSRKNCTYLSTTGLFRIGHRCNFLFLLVSQVIFHAICFWKRETDILHDVMALNVSWKISACVVFFLPIDIVRKIAWIIRNKWTNRNSFVVAFNWTALYYHRSILL